MILGRITADLLANVPDAVRAALDLHPGDLVAYQIEGDKVVITRSPYLPDDDGLPDTFVANYSTFWEWDSEADRIGYANL